MNSVSWLSRDKFHFPDIEHALQEPNGLLAVGGDLSIERLLSAYQRGIFPWYEDNQPILWWSPDPRCIIDPRTFTPGRSLSKRLKRNDYEIHVDRDFISVIRHCSQRPETNGSRAKNDTWLTTEMIDAYIRLHQAGFAHSVECWIDGILAGGLYGISLGNLFFGESMFHHVTDASKISFAWLMSLMSEADSAMVDCQIANPHLVSLGCKEVPRQLFRQLLDQGLAKTEIDWKLLAGRVTLHP